MCSGCAHRSYVSIGGFMLTFGTITRVSVFVFMKHTPSLSPSPPPVPSLVPLLSRSCPLPVPLLSPSCPPSVLQTQRFQLAIVAFAVQYSLLVVYWKDNVTLNEVLILLSVQRGTCLRLLLTCSVSCVGCACVNTHGCSITARSTSTHVHPLQLLRV